MLDIFGTNTGDFTNTLGTPLDPVFNDQGVYELGDSASRWFLGSRRGRFRDPGRGDVVATPFGWGTSMADYDNDGDTDVVFHGGMAFGPVVHTNLGHILQNDGTGGLTYDLEALTTNHLRRIVHGVAVGDLDDDGFTDIVSVSNQDIPESVPLRPHLVRWGSAIDELMSFRATFGPSVEALTVWIPDGFEDNDNGSLAVEINGAENGNGWFKVKLLGTVDLVDGGRANRDAVGAVVTSRVPGGPKTMRPVTGGSSYASQDSLELTFGLGETRRALLDVLWPGGVRNRLYRVRPGERLLLPEIPCGFDAEWDSIGEYANCLTDALGELEEAELVDSHAAARLFVSALRAFLDERR